MKDVTKKRFNEFLNVHSHSKAFFFSKTVLDFPAYLLEIDPVALKTKLTGRIFESHRERVNMTLNVEQVNFSSLRFHCKTIKLNRLTTMFCYDRPATAATRWPKACTVECLIFSSR